MGFSDTVQIACDLSYAVFHPLFFGTAFGKTNSDPLDSTMIFKKPFDMMPPFGFWRIGIFFCCFDVAFFLQRYDIRPTPARYCLFNKFVIIATVARNNYLFRVVWTDILLKLESLQIFNNSFVLRLILQVILATVCFCVKRYRWQRDQSVIEKQYNVGPLVADHKAFAMVKSLGILRMQT